MPLLNKALDNYQCLVAKNRPNMLICHEQAVFLLAFCQALAASSTVFSHSWVLFLRWYFQILARRCHAAYRSRTTPASICPVQGNWSNNAQRMIRWVSLNCRTFSARVVGLQDIYRIRSKRRTSSQVSGSMLARGGSTNTVPKLYSARLMCARRRNTRVPLRAWVSSSADSRTSSIVSMPLSFRLARAAFTEVLLISVARTLRTRVDSGRVKLPLPQ